MFQNYKLLCICSLFPILVVLLSEVTDSQEARGWLSKLLWESNMPGHGKDNKYVKSTSKIGSHRDPDKALPVITSSLSKSIFDSDSSPSRAQSRGYDWSWSSSSSQTPHHYGDNHGGYSKGWGHGGHGHGPRHYSYIPPPPSHGIGKTGLIAGLAGLGALGLLGILGTSFNPTTTIILLNRTGRRRRSALAPEFDDDVPPGESFSQLLGRIREKISSNILGHTTERVFTLPKQIPSSTTQPASPNLTLRIPAPAPVARKNVSYIGHMPKH